MELNEITKLVDKIYPEQINLKSFNYKKQLNPKIWEKNKIKKNVRKRLIKIAKEFVKSTDIDFIPVDILIVGSIASFNWSKYSDIDLHILVDFSKIKDITNEDVLKDYFSCKKNDWNNKHEDLTIHNYPVELYI